MGNCLKKEKAIRCLGLHEHDNTGRNYVEEDNDIESANDVEDDVPWTSQRLPKFAHHNGATEFSLEIKLRITGSSKCIDVNERCERWNRWNGCGDIKRNGKEATGQQDLTKETRREQLERYGEKEKEESLNGEGGED